MNQKTPFVPSQQTQREDAEKAAKAAAASKPALKAAATTIDYQITQDEIDLAVKYGGRASCSEIREDGTVVELIDDDGNWIGPEVVAKAVDDEEETPADRAIKHAELRRVLNELRSN